MKTFQIKPSKMEPGKIDVLCRNNQSHSSVWTLTAAEFAALKEVIYTNYVSAVTQAWERERASGH